MLVSVICAFGLLIINEAQVTVALSKCFFVS